MAEFFQFTTAERLDVLNAVVDLSFFAIKFAAGSVLPATFADPTGTPGQFAR
jgi:hypothetical protein